MKKTLAPVSGKKSGTKVTAKIAGAPANVHAKAATTVTGKDTAKKSDSGPVATATKAALKDAKLFAEKAVASGTALAGRLGRSEGLALGRPA